ncbi:MAG TPA: formate dehydrogenase accessory sulfurtransferase FdhD [Chryseosolibacter sp.]|nr:formate dehydrogenase accessory sulfurtransferase FdhD [Chryseosolibacter sp.]
MKTIGSESVEIRKVEGQSVSHAWDDVSVEEPLEIRLIYDYGGVREEKVISVTMRTPGQDELLAAGFLFTEGVIRGRDEIERIDCDPERNAAAVVLKPDVRPVLPAADRNFYTTSSCGVCGKSSIDSIRAVSVFRDAHALHVSVETIQRIAKQLDHQQVLFKRTGGVHASSLYESSGEHLFLCEDVGRHNALDKLIGAALLEGKLPLHNKILFLSGRISFELVQKGYMAGVSVIVAVGAPSTLAIALARETGITLVGFLRGDRYNVYAGWDRISVH